MASVTKQQRDGVYWAALTLQKHGAKLHSVSCGAWDVELADGSWVAANDWRELVDVAYNVQHDSEPAQVVSFEIPF